MYPRIFVRLVLVEAGEIILHRVAVHIRRAALHLLARRHGGRGVVSTHHAWKEEEEKKQGRTRAPLVPAIMS